MSPKKPKEFLFKAKGRCYEEDSKNRNKGIIYVSATHLRFSYKQGGEKIIPLNTIKKLNRYSQTWSQFARISIQTDANESYSFITGHLTRLYNSLSKAIANFSEGRDIQIGPKHNWAGIIITGFLIGIITLILFVIYGLTGIKLL